MADVKRPVRKGTSNLLTHLEMHLDGDGVKDAREEAIQMLRERGHMQPNSEALTPEGYKRSAMGHIGRAIDRAARLSGKPKKAYKFVDGRAVLK